MYAAVAAIPPSSIDWCREGADRFKTFLRIFWAYRRTRLTQGHPTWTPAKSVSIYCAVLCATSSRPWAGEVFPIRELREGAAAVTCNVDALPKLFPICQGLI